MKLDCFTLLFSFLSELFTRVFWNPFRHETPTKVPCPRNMKRTKGGLGGTRKGKETTCQLCKKHFRWPKELVYHHAYHHSGKKLNVCPEPTCGRHFQFPFQLAMHRRMAEHHDWRVSCKVCGKRFGASRNLSRHTPAACKKFKIDTDLKNGGKTPAQPED